LRIFKSILELATNVNVKGGEYGTALQAASCQGYLGRVRMLLKAGPDVNIEGGKYGTALAAAPRPICKNQEIIKVLLQAGAKVKATEKTLQWYSESFEGSFTIIHEDAEELIGVMLEEEAEEGTEDETNGPSLDGNLGELGELGGVKD